MDYHVQMLLEFYALLRIILDATNRKPDELVGAAQARMIIVFEQEHVDDVSVV